MSERLPKGSHAVTLGAPHWERLEPKNGDDARMALVIPCIAGDAMEYFRLNFTRTIIGSGKNNGKSCAALAAEQCIGLGMSEPFSPAKVHELEGQNAELVMDEEEYQGKWHVKPKYLNGQRKPRLSDDEAAEVWEKLSGKPAAKANAAPRPDPVDVDPMDDDAGDNLPF
jgi:hypothetical protein